MEGILLGIEDTIEEIEVQSIRISTKKEKYWHETSWKLENSENTKN